MKDQHQLTIHRRLDNLTELYYTRSLADYEAALQAAVKPLQQVLPNFTIAFAEIHTAGSNHRAHGGKCHVFMPTERNAQ